MQLFLVEVTADHANDPRSVTYSHRIEETASKGIDGWMDHKYSGIKFFSPKAYPTYTIGRVHFQIDNT